MSNLAYHPEGVNVKEDSARPASRRTFGAVFRPLLQTGGPGTSALYTERNVPKSAGPTAQTAHSGREASDRRRIRKGWCREDHGLGEPGGRPGFSRIPHRTDGRRRL